MDNSTTPLQGDILLVTQLDLLTSTTVDGTLYGIAFTLFCLYVHSLAPRLRDPERKTQAKFMLVFSSIIMFCGLFDLIASAWITQDTYIKHSDYPESPYFYEGTTLHAPLTISTFTCQMIIEFLTSVVQIWRVWVVWRATRYANFVVVLPTLCFLTFIALRLRSVILEATLSIPDLARLDEKTEQVEDAIQGAVTVLCTLLISLYLIYRHWRQRKLIGKAQGSVGYMGVVAILIESYALESIWLLIVSKVWDKPEIAFFTESVNYIQIIAYLLVQYRVASGTAYESQRGQSKISSLHWNHSNHVTTQFGEASEVREVGSGHLVPAKPETLDASQSSGMV